MRIAIFTDSYKPYTSGVVNSIISFKEELTKLGHEIIVLAPKYPVYEAEKNVYRLWSLPTPTGTDFTLALPYLKGVNEIIKDIDLIHVHSPFIMGRMGMFYAQKYEIPLIFTYHTMYDQYTHYVPMPQSLVQNLTNRFCVNFCNKCDQIIVPSSQVQKKLIKENVRAPVIVLPTGVPLKNFSDGDMNWLNQNYPNTRNKRVLLYVGRLAKEKNLEFLIKAFKNIKRRIDDTVLVLVAKGPAEKELRNLVENLEMKIDTDVIFTGAMPFEALKNVYSSAYLFTFTSMTETQGLVLIEAMATGLPVVAVAASGVEDMVDHGRDGLLCAHDLDSFVDTVCMVLQDAKLYSNLKKQTKKKAEKLSSQEMALKLESLYYSLINNSHVSASSS